MASQWRWFLRMARIVATGVVLAIVVLEIQLVLGFRLVDTPLFRYPWPTVGLIVAALAFAAYNIWTTATGAWATLIVMWQVRLRMRATRPRARARQRFSVGPSSA